MFATLIAIHAPASLLLGDDLARATSLTAKQTEQIDKVFAALDKPARPGCSVCVVRDGNVLYSRGFGLAQMEYDIAIEPNTIFHIASISKQFAVFAVALLESEGKLDLDDEVRKFIAEVPDFGKPVTLRHLIHHTSGLRDQWDLFVLAGGRMDDVISTTDVLELVSKQAELNFEPGQEHVYCNTGYTLLGVVVERVAGVSFPEFCDQRIFKPLEMSRTHFHDDHRRIVPGRAYSYRKYRKRRSDGYEKSVLSYANAGATSLFTTAEDLTRWQQNFEQRTIGDDQVFATMLTRGKLNDGTVIDYAGGVVHGKHRGLEMVSHGGADAGFRSFLGSFPKQQLSVAVLGNYASCNPRRLAMAAVDVVLADTFPESDRAKKSERPEGLSEFLSDESASEEAQELTQQELDVASWYFDRSGPVIYVVTATDKQLHLQSGFRKPILLDRTAPFHFKSTNRKFPFAIQFDPESEDPRGRATIRFPGGRPTPLEPVGAKGAATDYESTLPGRYFSQELDAYYDIVSEGEKLRLKRRRHGVTDLQLRFEDGFASGRNTIRLTRSEDGAIDGFLLSTGRVRNLRFRRNDDQASLP